MYNNSWSFINIWDWNTKLFFYYWVDFGNRILSKKELLNTELVWQVIKNYEETLDFTQISIANIA